MSPLKWCHQVIMVVKCATLCYNTSGIITHWGHKIHLDCFCCNLWEVDPHFWVNCLDYSDIWDSEIFLMTLVFVGNQHTVHMWHYIKTKKCFGINTCSLWTTCSMSSLGPPPPATEPCLQVWENVFQGRAPYSSQEPSSDQLHCGSLEKRKE